MVLPLMTIVSPEMAGPPHGLSLRGVRQSSLPLLASRQSRARSPVFSWSRNVDAATTLSPTTASGASTCHFSLPSCQTRLGSGRRYWDSLGGGVSGFFLRSFSYLACRSNQPASTVFLSVERSSVLPARVARFASTHRTPALPPPRKARPSTMVGELSRWTRSPGTLY